MARPKDMQGSRRPATLSRRHFTRGLAATAAMPVLGAPWVARAADLTVGAVLPLSGGLDIFGAQARLGLELAKAEINAAGGIGGQPVALAYRDEAADPQRAKDTAEALIGDDGVIAIAGPITSASRNAMSAVLAGSGVPLLYATDYEGGDCGENLFYFNSVPNQSATPLMAYLLDRAAGSVFMLGADYIWPKAMFDACAAVVEARGDTVAGRRFVPLAGLADYSPVLDAIRASGARILILALPGAAHDTFLAQAVDHKWFESLTICTLGDLAVFYPLNKSRPSISAFGCVPFVAIDSAPAVRDFVARVRKQAGAGTVVTSDAATHYNALMALKTGVERSGQVSRAAAIAGMAGLKYQTPTGPSLIDANDRHSTLNMYVVQIVDGRPKIVESLGQIAPEAGCA